MKQFLKIWQNSQENTCAIVSFFPFFFHLYQASDLQKANQWTGFSMITFCHERVKKETLALVFFCEFCQSSKNISLTEHLWAIAPEKYFGDENN